MPIFKKLNQTGFSHHLVLPLLVVLAITAIGVRVLSVSKAATTLPASPANYRAMWVWSENIVQSSTQTSSLISFAKTHKINVLYLNAGGLIETNPTGLARFIQVASYYSVQVELLYGQPEWALTANHAKAVNLVNQAVAFAANHPATQRPRGITFDVEPHTLPQWAANPTSVQIQLLTMYSKVKTASQNKLRVGAAYQMAFDTYSISLNGITNTLSNWLIAIVDEPVLMDYRNSATSPVGDNIISHAQPSVAFAKKANKKVYLGLETNCITPPKITFCGLGNTKMQAAITATNNFFTGNPGLGGWVIHDYAGYKALAP